MAGSLVLPILLSAKNDIKLANGNPSDANCWYFLTLFYYNFFLYF
jgi:hypothetical protein